MYKRSLILDLSPQGIRTLIHQVEDFNSWIEEKTNELTARLAEVGLEFANIYFTSVASFYNNGSGMDASLSVERIDKGYAIRARGTDVCFIEFGAGVTYGTGYPGVLPEGVVGIGQYGKGHGSDPNGWRYPVADGWKHTKGNPPAAGMFGAEQRIRQLVYSIAKEVFA